MFKVAKKIFATLVLMVTMLFATFGQCQAQDLSAEKMILAYAQVYGYGATPYAKEAGFAQDDISAIRQIFFNRFRDSFKDFCLSDASRNQLTEAYLRKLESSLDITAKLKVDDPNNPVVTITAKVIDEADFENQANNAPNIQGLAFAIMGMKNEGKTEADLKVDATVQATAQQDCITKFLNGLNFGGAQSIDVTCTKEKSSDGKMHWAPVSQDGVALYEFMSGMQPTAN